MTPTDDPTTDQRPPTPGVRPPDVAGAGAGGEVGGHGTPGTQVDPGAFRTGQLATGEVSADAGALPTGQLATGEVSTHVDGSPTGPLPSTGEVSADPRVFPPGQLPSTEEVPSTGGVRAQRPLPSAGGLRAQGERSPPGAVPSAGEVPSTGEVRAEGEVPSAVDLRAMGEVQSPGAVPSMGEVSPPDAVPSTGEVLPAGAFPPTRGAPIDGGFGAGGSNEARCAYEPDRITGPANSGSGDGGTVVRQRRRALPNAGTATYALMSERVRKRTRRGAPGAPTDGGGSRPTGVANTHLVGQAKPTPSTLERTPTRRRLAHEETGGGLPSATERRDRRAPVVAVSGPPAPGAPVWPRSGPRPPAQDGSARSRRLQTCDHGHQPWAVGPRDIRRPRADQAGRRSSDPAARALDSRFSGCSGQARTPRRRMDSGVQPARDARQAQGGAGE